MKPNTIVRGTEPAWDHDTNIFTDKAYKEVNPPMTKPYHDATVERNLGSSQVPPTLSSMCKTRQIDVELFLSKCTHLLVERSTPSVLKCLKHRLRLA